MNQYGIALEKQLAESGFITQGFTLTTMYPGLLYGTGYPHNVKAEGAITVGFALDYVTGLPIIQGSSLKGTLRSFFPDKKKSLSAEWGALLKDLIKPTQVISEKDIARFFEDEDVFLGAFPIVESNCKNILAGENITPHDAENLKNPVPIAMLKVKPEVKYRFLFQLTDSTLDNGQVFTKDDKLELYKKLILLGGIGAKTNVGFGQFRDDTPIKREWMRKVYTFVVTGYLPGSDGRMKYLALKEKDGEAETTCPYYLINSQKRDATGFAIGETVKLMFDRMENDSPRWRKA